MSTPIYFLIGQSNAVYMTPTVFPEAFDRILGAGGYDFVSYTLGSTALARKDNNNDWSPDSPDELFEASLAHLAAHLAETRDRGEIPELGGIIWMQGERDSLLLEDAAAYGENLSAFLSAYRTRVADLLPEQFGAASEVPLVLSQMAVGRRSPYNHFVREGQRAAAQDADGVHFISTDDLDRPDYGVHFDLESPNGAPELADRLIRALTDPASVAPDPGPPAIEDFIGTEADDRFVARTGNHFAALEGGNDFARTGGGGDGLAGGAGEDTLISGGGNDTVYGGDGGDLLIGGGGDDQLFGLEGDDTMRGGGGDDVVYGYYGNDALLGGAGGDRLRGGYDDDMLVGGAGADSLFGDSGFDTVKYLDSTVGVRIDLAAGTGEGGTAEGDLLYQIERVIGSRFADTLIGTNLNDVLIGHDGDDILFGGSRSDTLSGGAGEDIFVFKRNDGSNLVQDFEEGDRLALATNRVSFEDLSITQAGRHTHISYDTGEIVLRGVDAETIGRDDVLFGYEFV